MILKSKLVLTLALFCVSNWIIAQTTATLIDFEPGNFGTGGPHSPVESTTTSGEIDNSYYSTNYGIQFQFRNGSSTIPVHYAQVGVQSGSGFAFGSSGSSTADTPDGPLALEVDSFFISDKKEPKLGSAMDTLVVLYDTNKTRCTEVSGHILDINSNAGKYEGFRLNVYGSSATIPDQSIEIWASGAYNNCPTCISAPPQTPYASVTGNRQVTPFTLNTAGAAPIQRLEAIYIGSSDKMVGFGFDNFTTCENQPSICYETITEVACDSYTSPSGSYIWTSSGNYMDTIFNAGGNCDSVFTVNLTINTVDTSVTQSGMLLTANQAGAEYQWLNCEGMQPLMGDTNQTFQPTANGNFALAISHNGCTDTSGCYRVSNVGLLENIFSGELSVFPNPTNGAVTLDMGKQYPVTTLKILNITGELIQTSSFRNGQHLNFVLDGPAGVYFLHVTAGVKQAVLRVNKY